MSESQGKYQVADLKEDTNVRCSCGFKIGVLVDFEGLELLKTSGGMIVRYMHGFCQTCGAEIHWSVSDRMLQRLIKRSYNIKDQLDLD